MMLIWCDKLSELLPSRTSRVVLCALILVLLFPFDLLSITLSPDSTTSVSEATAEAIKPIQAIDNDSTLSVVADSVAIIEPQTLVQADSVTSAKAGNSDEWLEVKRTFNPSPTRAVWLSALFPGLGQIYNRRYWKLPIVIGGYLGLGYATSWNNGMLNDYTRAYRDIMDNDPTTNSYMNFFPSTTKEEDLNQQWLQNILKSRKNYFRRNRDLCIICMVGLYLVAMVDAYVDASLSHFDISPDLSLEWAPLIMQDTRNARPSVGLQWAFTF